MRLLPRGVVCWWLVPGWFMCSPNRNIAHQHGSRLTLSGVGLTLSPKPEQLLASGVDTFLPKNGDFWHRWRRESGKTPVAAGVTAWFTLFRAKTVKCQLIRFVFHAWLTLFSVVGCWPDYIHSARAIIPSSLQLSRSSRFSSAT